MCTVCITIAVVIIIWVGALALVLYTQHQHIYHWANNKSLLLKFLYPFLSMIYDGALITIIFKLLKESLLLPTFNLSLFSASVLCINYRYNRHMYILFLFIHIIKLFQELNYRSVKYDNMTHVGRGWGGSISSSWTQNWLICDKQEYFQLQVGFSARNSILLWVITCTILFQIIYYYYHL